MVIIITGAIGIGKTTVCEKVVKIARSSGYSCGGILTHKVAHESLIVLDIQTGEKAILASTDNTFDGPRTLRYSFNPEAIKFGIRAIYKAIDSDVLIIDEIGHLELDGEGFAKSLEFVKTGRVKNSILVIRKELLPAFLAQLGDNPTILETTISTRDRLPRKICSSLTGNLPDFSSQLHIGQNLRVPSRVDIPVSLPLIAIAPRSSFSHPLLSNLGYVNIYARNFLELQREVTDYSGKALNLKLRDSNGKGEQRRRAESEWELHQLMVGKDVNPEHTLAYTLRETLGYTGTKIACNHGGCGACTVLMDGEAVLIPQRWIVYMLVLNKLVTEYDG